MPLAIVTPEDLRFVIGIVLTLIASKFYNLRKGRAAILWSLFILYVTFDIHLTLFVLSSHTFNVLLLYLFRCNEYFFTLCNFLILYVFKIKGKCIDPKIKGTYDISGVLMLTTIKMCYLGRDFDRKKHSLRDVIGYLTFVPGLIMGPTPTFKEYIENEEKGPDRFPWWELTKATMFLLLFKFVFDVYFPISVIYEKKWSIWIRLVNLYCFNFGQRMRFYFAWNFTEACYVFQGFDAMKNINFSKVELATCIKDLSAGWNIKVNEWLKRCFFEKLKHKSILFASVVTFIVSALWHGINLGYLIMFMSFCISIPIVKGINRLVLRKLNFLFPIISRLQMVLFIMYFSSPFFILDLKNTLIAWKNVYFYGHIYCVACGLMFLIRL